MLGFSSKKWFSSDNFAYELIFMLLLFSSLIHGTFDEDRGKSNNLFLHMTHPSETLSLKRTKKNHKFMSFRHNARNIFYFYLLKSLFLVKDDLILKRWSIWPVSDITGVKNRTANSFTNGKWRHKHSFTFIKHKQML